MTEPFEATEASNVLTLEEIANLTEDGGKPADTLMNVVALIATRFRTDVCSAYLLEPDRSNLVLAASLGLHPRCIGTLRMPLHEGLAGLVAEQVLPVAVDDVKKHPRFKYFKESGEDEYHSFLGVPLIDRGILQGVLVVQTKESRAFREDEVRMLVEAANEVAPVVSEARTLDRFIGPAQERLWSLARNLWWSWDPDCVSLFRDLNPTRWRQLNQNPIALLSEIPLEEIERRATELVLHSRINYVYRRQQEYLNADRTWGAGNAGILRPRPVAYFSLEFGLHESLPIYSGGLGVLAGDHIKSASDLGIPLVGVGLFYGQGYFLQRLDERGWQREEYLQTDVNQLPMAPAIGANGEPVLVEIRTRSGTIRAKVWRVKVGRCDLLLLIETQRRAFMEETLARASARNCCLGSAAFALSRRWASLREFSISTRGTAALWCLRRFAAACRKRASTLLPRPARFRGKWSLQPTLPCPQDTTGSTPI
jgi:starch phosphorylase